MKTLDDVVDERFNLLFEAAEKGPGGRGGQAYKNLLDAEAIVYKVNDAAREGGYTVDYHAIWNHDGRSMTALGVLTPKLTIVCSNGHTFKCSVNKFIMSVLEEKSEPCGQCRRNLSLVMGTPQQSSARVRVVMQHDERGEDIYMEFYEDVSFGHPYKDRVSGLDYKTYATNLQNWTRPQSKSKPVVWCARDNQWVFFWTGDQPIVENPIIKDLLDRAADPADAGAEIDLWFKEDAHKKGYTHRSGLSMAIQEAIDLGAKVLNISLNPQYEVPGRYSYGDLTKGGHPLSAALAEWISDIEQKWQTIREDR